MVRLDSEGINTWSAQIIFEYMGRFKALKMTIDTTTTANIAMGYP